MEEKENNEPLASRPAGGLRLAAALVFALLLASGCAKYPASMDSLGGTVTGQSVVRSARAAVGTPYRPGGDSLREGFDCSGLVCWAYAKNGVSLPRTTVEQRNLGRSVSKGSLQPGDIVVFNIRRGLHTGIYTGDGKFIHSPSRGKTVREESLNQAYWAERFVEGRRPRQVQ